MKLNMPIFDIGIEDAHLPSRRNMVSDDSILILILNEVNEVVHGQ